MGIVYHPESTLLTASQQKSCRVEPGGGHGRPKLIVARRRTCDRTSQYLDFLSAREDGGASRENCDKSWKPGAALSGSAASAVQLYTFSSHCEPSSRSVAHHCAAVRHKFATISQGMRLPIAPWRTLSTRRRPTSVSMNTSIYDSRWRW